MDNFYPNFGSFLPSVMASRRWLKSLFHLNGASFAGMYMYVLTVDLLSSCV